MSAYYIDCEFDGHGGPLLSIALVQDSGRSIHIRTTERALDPWVIANVETVMDLHEAPMSQWIPLNEVGPSIKSFIGDDAAPTIIADSPVDIGRFCQAISTGADGGWASADYPLMTFEVRNVDCYPTDLPGAIQHNAWWDAMALRAIVPETLLVEREREVSGPDPKAVADGLSEAQRRALIELCNRGSSPYGYYASELGVSGAALMALASRGLVQSGKIYGDRTMAYRPRELGLAVKRELETRP